MSAVTEAWKTLVVDYIGEPILAWARPEGHPISPFSEKAFASSHAAWSVAFGYLAFVAVGVYFMKNVRGNKKLEGLYGFKFAYNIIQVMLCSYMCLDAFVQAYRHNYTLMPCEPFNATNPVMGDILYIFYLSKILDFADTVFIIAECRWKQLSFLHVYHHFSIFLFYWLNLNVGFDGDVFLTIILNGFIHTIMYTYYFVSLHTSESIWWKKYLTQSQMIQFALMNFQAAYLVLNECTAFPIRIIKAYFYYIISLLILFMHFYLQDNYFNKKVRGAKKAEAAVTEEEDVVSPKKTRSRSAKKRN
jgi:elongation of very long chain fatty acids protein 4